jgi:co-chaperonin GroES (HSP10)
VRARKERRVIKPTKGRIVVKQDSAPEKAGSLVIPDLHQEAPPEGVVVAVARDVTEVNPGDRVMYRKWGKGMWAPNGDEMLIVMPIDDVLGVFDAEA